MGDETRNTEGMAWQSLVTRRGAAQRRGSRHESHWKRHGAMKVTIGAVALIAVALAASACGSSKPSVSGKVTWSGTTPTWQGLISHGKVSCTATLTTPVPVPVGEQLRFVFRFKNNSKHPAKV